MRSQNLPISVIVIIVIAVVVLAAVLLFFFGAFGKPTNTVNTQGLISRCNTIAEEVQSSNPKDNDEAGTLASNFGFCEPRAEYSNMNCGNVTHPVIHTQTGDCRLTCTSSGTSCESI